MKKLRVWWIPQVPMKMFTADVRSLREAKLLLTTLADYDIFQYENRVKPDFCNAGGLQEFDPEDTEDGPDGSWTDWYDDETGHDIDHLSDEDIDRLERLDDPAPWEQEAP